MVIGVLFGVGSDGMGYFVQLGLVYFGMLLLEGVLIVGFGSELAIVLQESVVVHR